MIRENLETYPIASYRYFGKYKFRIRYAGQQTTCGYCAEKDHMEHDCKTEENMIILTNNSKMERRLAKNPPGSTSEIEPSEPLPTLEEAKQSFEINKRKSSIPKEQEENKKVKSKENQPPTTQKDSANKDSGKRPLSDSSPYNKQKSRRKTSIGERNDSPFKRDPEISSGSSSIDFSEFKVFADLCCHELIQKCTGKHFACACQKQF